MNDEDHLDRLLRQCPPPIELPHGFEHRVWARIELSQPLSLSSQLSLWVAQLLASFSRPAMATALLLLCLVAGVATGYRAADAQLQAHAIAYQETVNPLIRAYKEGMK